MAELSELTWEYDNVFIRKYAPQNLKWYEKDGLQTWYRHIKCEESLNNTDLHFAKRKIKNFDIIKNYLPDNKLKQYQLTDHEEIKYYPLEFQDQIRSSIFRSADCKDMNISKKTIKEHFNNSNKVPNGGGRFLKKKNRDYMYAKEWW